MRAVRSGGDVARFVALAHTAFHAVDGYIPKPIEDSALQDILERARASAASASVQE